MSQDTARRVLLLTHNTFYNHSNLETIEDVLPRWGEAAGFTITSPRGFLQTLDCSPQNPCQPSVADLSMITADYLAQFDAIITSTNGELPFTDAGKQALVDFVHRDGKAIVFLHQSPVTLYGFKPWGEMLGAYIAENATFDARNAGARVAVMKIEDRTHPASFALPQDWVLHDEFYQFARKAWDPADPTSSIGPTGLPVPHAFSRDNVHVLVSLDSHRTDMSGVKGWEVGGDYPQVWWQDVGKGRTFYSAVGHREELWTRDPVFRDFMISAIRWALRLEI